MSKPKNIGLSTPVAGRNNTITPLRLQLEAILSKLPPGETLSMAALAERTGAPEKTIGLRLRDMHHVLIAVNVAPQGAPGAWRLTVNGRRHLIGEEAPAPKAKGTDADNANSTVAGSRTWHNNSQPNAAIGTLSPWAGTPVREGSLEAFTWPSKGTRA
jgi:hypothetical protein